MSPKVSPKVSEDVSPKVVGKLAQRDVFPSCRECDRKERDQLI